ncbi:MAG: 5-formyltetrahydrofolate cyclo-ligase [Victivallales bacterium]|nr:5-formyltetrahydrofolate cyclo-ligase [Victivallales bacterium]
MESDAANAKQVLRKEMKALLRGLVNVPHDQGERMVNLLRANGLWDGFSSLAGFLPFRREPDILPVLEQWLREGKCLYLPVYEPDTALYTLAQVQGLGNDWLAPGNYGILEPLHSLPRLNPPFAHQVPSLWLVPGLAFSADGARLGRGAGFYDRLLDGADGIRIGVAHDCQIVANIPCDRHDVKMDYLLTGTTLLPCATHAGVCR